MEPDWTKARQALHQGKSIVRVPILNVDKLNHATAVSANNAGYYAKHPPEIFFLQNADGQIAGYLLNFIPKDVQHNFGENGIWTGELIEWNVKGDTLHVIEFADNKIVKDKLIAPASTTKTNSIGAVLKQNKLALAANNGNGGFWSFLGRVLGAVADFLGLPTRDTIIDGLRVDWTIIGSDISSWFDGAESYYGSTGGGADGYLSAGGPIYVSYLGASGGGNTNTGTTGANVSQIVFTEYKIYKGGPNHIDPPLDVDDYIVTELGFTGNAANYLMSHIDVQLALENYLDANGRNFETIEFVNWVVEYSMSNLDIQPAELIEANNIPNWSINLPNLIDTTGLSPYPSFKAVVSNLPAFLSENPDVITSLIRYTGFSKTKLMQLMQPNKGPKIQLVSNLVDEYGRPCFGQFDPGSKTLKIKKELVVGLDKVQSPNRYSALGMLLAIVTMHEFVHYGRDVNKLTKRVNIGGILYEAGMVFELSISPSYIYDTIDRNNAIQWVKFFNFNIND